MQTDAIDKNWGEARLTSQDAYFPKHLLFSPQPEGYEAYKIRIGDQLFEIQDDLLYSCITYGDGLKCSLVSGFTQSKRGLGYAFLTFFVSRALGLYRLPFCPDRAYDRVPGGLDAEERLRKVLPELTHARVDSICAEVQALYAHTQRLLKEAALAHVVLKRNVEDIPERRNPNALGYAELLFKLKAACELIGRKTLRFEMDVLNSYGDDGGYGHYPVAIRHKIPAENVFYCSNFIRSRDHFNNGVPRMAVETGEWVVINRATDGVIELPVSALELNTKEWVDRWERRSRNQEAAERFISSWEPVVLRGLRSLSIEHRFEGGGLRLRPIARLYAALKILWTGRHCPYI